MRYPPDWFLYPSSEEGLARSTTLTSYEIEGVISTEGDFQPGDAKISFSTGRNRLENIQDKVSWVVENLLYPESEVSSAQEITVGKSTAVRVDFTLFDETQTYIYIPRETDLLFISATYTDTATAALVEEILTTIKLD